MSKPEEVWRTTTLMADRCMRSATRSTRHAMQQLAGFGTFLPTRLAWSLAAVDGDAHRGDGAQERGGGQDERRKVIRVSHSVFREGSWKK